MPEVRNRSKLRNCTISVLAVAATLLAAGASPAPAAEGDETTTTVTIQESSGNLISTIKLNFDEPISAEEASRIESSLKSTPSIQSRQATPLASKAAAVSGDKMWCGGSISDGDANSTFNIDYNCDTSPRRLRWGWRIKPALSRFIVPGTLNERGLSWWRNGVFRGQNGPHAGLPGDYQIHGNINPVYRNNDVDYQDYATFRHLIGPGGGGEIAWAGSVVLQN